MKIVVINGQTHKGNTYSLKNLLIDNISGEKEVREFFLPNDLNHFCTGCCSCIEDELRCPFYEEKNRIMKGIENADLLVFTTPNYCMAPSAPMKAFIDLTFTYWLSHKPRGCMFHKKAVVLSTTAGSGTRQAIKPIKKTLSYWGISYIKTYGVTVRAKNWITISEKRKVKIEKDINKLAKTLTKCISPSVSLKTIFMFNIFASMQKADWGSSPKEKEYWVSHGWLGKERPWNQ